MKKFCAFFLLAPALLCAADFQTGQAARAVIGQETFTRQYPGASERLLGGVSGLAYADNTLFVVDSNRVEASPVNHRVLIYRNLSGMLPAPGAQLPEGAEVRCPVCQAVASTVLGQRNFELSGLNGTTATSSDGKPVGDVRAISNFGLRVPTGVASDGRRLVVADTDNNRILIWNSIPESAAAPADLVLGQSSFTNNVLNYGGTGNTPSAKGLRGPQGVWIQGDMLFVADTQNHRVLGWTSWPTQNGQDANLVLGQQNFTSYVQPDIARDKLEPTAAKMLNPVSVTSDGQRLYVADLGHNRILVWNGMPTQNFQPADIALGQPDMTSAVANNSPKLCESNGTNDKSEPTFPVRCAATIEFPRYALAAGGRLFVADGGNDRVLIYNSIPTSSGARADVILGQKDEFSNFVQDTDIFGQNAQFNPDMVGSNALRTPMSLAWDGANLFVSDPFNRRVLVFTPGDQLISDAGVRNAASLDIFAVGSVSVSGKIKENEEAIVKIVDKEYKYKVLKDDTLDTVITALVGKINEGSGDPNVLATPNLIFQAIILTARRGGPEANNIEYASGVTATAAGTLPDLTLTAGGATLRGGQDAARIAPGTLVTLMGTNFTDREASAPTGATVLPKELAGVEVYFDGIRAPLLYVSPTQINTQMPFVVSDASSVTAWVRTRDASGNVKTSTAVPVSIIFSNPGIFAESGSDPRPAIVLHESSFASGAIRLDGTAKENDVVTISIGEGDSKRDYRYTVKKVGDKVQTNIEVRDELVKLINGEVEGTAADPQVRADRGGVFATLRLFARESGEAGNGVKFAASVPDGAGVIPSALGDTLCCASTAGARVTPENPAVPGETIVIYATGLGLVNPTEAQEQAVAGAAYTGPEFNSANVWVDALAGAKTANLLFAGLVPGTIGIYKVVLQLNADLPTNPQTQMTIAQDIYVSNIVTFPLKNPKDEQQTQP